MSHGFVVPTTFYESDLPTFKRPKSHKTIRPKNAGLRRNRDAHDVAPLRPQSASQKRGQPADSLLAPKGPARNRRGSAISTASHFSHQSRRSQLSRASHHSHSSRKAAVAWIEAPSPELETQRSLLDEGSSVGETWAESQHGEGEEDWSEGEQGSVQPPRTLAKSSRTKRRPSFR